MDRTEQPDTDEEAIARLLQAAGPREQLPAEMKQRWEQQFRADLEPVLDHRRTGRRRIIMGLCASLALVAVALGLVLLPPADSPIDIRVSQVIGEIRLQSLGRDTQELLPGEQVSTGSVIETGQDGHVALVYGGYDLRLNSHTRLALEVDHIALVSGEIYASDYESHSATRALRIDTPLGSIRDIGTQFTVAALPDRIVTTVRRGAVLIDTGHQEWRAEAIPGVASRLTVDQQQRVHRDTTDPGGDEWRWIYRAGSDFSLEGKSAYEFLRWSVGESGLQLEFASEGARIRAHTIVLHGNIAGLDPEQAVAPVLASTDLVAERTAANTLQIRLVSSPR